MTNFWKEYGKSFLLGFVFVGILLFVVRIWDKPVKLPENIAVILSPHFDDAVLSLGGFMAEHKAPVVVATFFAGKPSEPIEGEWDKHSGFKDSDKAIEARVAENLLALKQTGAYSLNLRHIDFQYRPERDSVSGEKIFRSMKSDIETIIKDFSGAESISLYGPSEFGDKITHPDHKLLHDAFAAVAREKSGGNSPRRIRFFFYEDFPYVKHYETSTTTSLKTFLERANSGISLCEMPLPVPSSAVSKKLELIKTYASQEQAFESLGADIGKEAGIFTENRCKKTKPAWEGCEVVYEI